MIQIDAAKPHCMSTSHIIELPANTSNASVLRNFLAELLETNYRCVIKPEELIHLLWNEFHISVFSAYVGQVWNGPAVTKLAQDTHEFFRPFKSLLIVKVFTTGLDFYDIDNRFIDGYYF